MVLKKDRNNDVINRNALGLPTRTNRMEDGSSVGCKSIVGCFDEGENHGMWVMNKAAGIDVRVDAYDVSIVFEKSLEM